MSDQTELTPEQIEEQEAIKRDAESVSYRWMRHNPEFHPTPRNAAILGDWIANHGGDWTEENLDSAFAAVRDRLEVSTPPSKPTPAPQVFPWGSRLTKQSLARMSREDYRRHFKDAEFRQQIADLNEGANHEPKSTS